MEIISWNVNGIRAAYEKGLLDFLRERSPDIFCIQEIKADPVDIPSEFKQLSSLEKLGGYKTYWNSSKLRGHRGVGVLTKKNPEEVERKLMDGRFGKDGRVSVLRFLNFTLVNLYLPHGKRDQSRVPKKLDMYEELFEFLKSEERIILCGDFNVAYEEKDLERPEENRRNTMFLDRERKQIDRLIDEGYVDTFRHLHPDEKKYSWWSYMNNAREKDIGWRIDYIFISRDLTDKLKDAFILNDVKGSDHCPVGVEINIIFP